MVSDGTITHDLVPGLLPDDINIASVASELKKRRHSKQKSGRAAYVKLKSVRPPRLTSVVHQDVSDPLLRRSAIEEHLQQLDKLPGNSAFAKHRRQMLQKALELLDRCWHHNNLRLI